MKVVMVPNACLSMLYISSEEFDLHQVASESQMYMMEVQPEDDTMQRVYYLKGLYMKFSISSPGYNLTGSSQFDNSYNF